MLLILTPPIQVANTVQGSAKLLKFLSAVLPSEVPYDETATTMQTRDDLIKDVFDGISSATMAIRMTLVMFPDLLKHRLRANGSYSP